MKCAITGEPVLVGDYVVDVGGDIYKALGRKTSHGEHAGECLTYANRVCGIAGSVALIHPAEAAALMVMSAAIRSVWIGGRRGCLTGTNGGWTSGRVPMNVATLHMNGQKMQDERSE